MEDIVENAERVAGYIVGMNLLAFENSALTRDAVERCLERICEAAHRLGPHAAELIPTQPWTKIRGMGNLLRHAYDKINVGVVWEVCWKELPILAADAKEALSNLGTAG